MQTRLSRLALRAAIALPGPLGRALFGRPPVNGRGERLGADVNVLNVLNNAQATTTDVAASRRSMRSGCAIAGARARDVPVRELNVAGRRARSYRPAGAHATLVYLHGGGWAVGDLDTHDTLCRRLAVEAGWEVLALDYPLAPEHPFPAGLDHVVAAFREIAGPRVALGGDSAGGNLAAAACQVLRDTHGPQPFAQVLLYPALDRRLLTPSHAEFATGFGLTHDRILWYLRLYGDPDPTDPRVSPGLHREVSGLPPAIVTSAGFDPLRDEADEYVARLRGAGVPVEHLYEPELIHGYANMDGVLPTADRAMARVIEALRALRPR